MADFTYDSNFSTEKSIMKVRFGGGAKILETEANELQDIQNYLRSRILKLLIPTGVQKKGTVSVTGSADNSFYTGRMDMWLAGYPLTFAYANGFENNKVTLAAPTSARADLVYAECWFENIDHDADIYRFGGEDSGDITNDILDSRIGLETSQRVQLRWRLRTVPNINFTTNPKGVTDSLCVARGAKTSDVAGKTFTQDSDDVGLYKAGTGSEADKLALGTYDGYSYAIPLFRVNRGTATIALVDIVDLRIDSVASSTAFGKVAVSGQSDIVAESIMDTITLIAGTNISITTDPATDAVTINVSGKVADADKLDGLDSTAFAPNSEAVLNGASGLMTGYEKALVAQMFAKWEAKDIAGAVGSNTTDATAFSGTARTCSAAGVMVNGSSAGKSLRFLPYIAIFRIKASTTGVSSLTLKIKRSGGTDLVSRTVTATEVGTSWAYFKLPFVFETAGETVYPEITYGTTGATFSVDSIVVSPDTAVLA